MLKIQEIREIIRLVDQSSISEFSYEHDGSSVSIKKEKEQVALPEVKNVVPEPIVQQQVPEIKKAETSTLNVEEAKPVSQENISDDHITELVSPMVGTFYRRPSPDHDNFVEIGDKVKEDSIVCIVEAMKLFNEIEAETAGELVEILVNDGELVEYGQPLFKVKTK